MYILKVFGLHHMACGNFFTQTGFELVTPALEVESLNHQTSREVSNRNCFFSFLFFISWRLITLQYCSRFFHTLKSISHGFTCVPHPNPPSHLPVLPISLGLPSAPGLSACLMHRTWAGDLFHP